MVEKAIMSVVVGGALSLALSAPLVIHQYRRFGRLSAGRAAWSAGTVVYLTSLITYTFFPLPDMSAEYCARSPHEFLLDPTAYFSDMARHLAGQPLQMALASWDVRQMILNVALFAPLGLLCRDFLEWGVLRSLATGFGVSLAIELTQYTGNWGLAPCQYRVADINDLITNTLGTGLGIGIAALTPRLVASAGHLAAHRCEARPVTRGRRLLGMALDGVYWTWAALLGMACGAVAWTAVHGLPMNSRLVHPEQVVSWGLVGAMAAELGVIVIPSLVGSGASLGQRTVYLRPAPAARPRLIARAMAVGGLQCLLTVPLPLLAFLWTTASVIVALVDVSGMSGLLTGCRFVDARVGAPERGPAAAPVAEPAAEPVGAGRR